MLYQKLQEVCENHHIYQLIKDPTRITETSFTLIDHFYTSNVDKIVSSGVIHTGLSAHSMVYASWGRAIKQKTFEHKYKVNRKYNRFDDKEFVKHINPNRPQSNKIQQGEVKKMH